MDQLPKDYDTAVLHAVNAAAGHLAEASHWRGVAEAALREASALRDKIELILAELPPEKLERVKREVGL